MLPHAWLKSLRAWFHTPFRVPIPRAQRKSYRSRGPSAVRLSWLEPLEPREVPAVFGLGGPADDSFTSVKLDAAGNEYVTGSFSGFPGAAGVPVDFDPGPGTTTLTNADPTADAFVAKYSPTGQLLWVGQIPNGAAAALALDENGNVLVTGSFTGTTDFDFGPGTATLTAGTFGAGYVAKYTPDGGLVWADQLGNSGVSASTITVDGAGNVYSAGVLNNGTADMDPGPGTFNLTNSSGNDNTYISKLDASGNFVWAEQFANDPSVAAGVSPEDIGVDADQRVYISGLFVNRVNFDTSGGTHWVTAADTPGGNYGDAYVARLTAAGGLDYLVTMGTATGRDDGYGIAVDPSGTAYVTGAFMRVAGQPASPFTITPATGAGAQLTIVPNSDLSVGVTDLYVMRLDSVGGLDWARSIGGPGDDGGQSIAIGPDGLYLTGFFNGTVDFDPNAGVQNASGAGGLIDDFVLQLATDSTFLNVQTFGGTDYEYPNDIAVNGGGAVGVVGRYRGSGDFEPGSGVTTLTSAGRDDAYVIQIPAPSTSPANTPPVAADQSKTVAEDTTPVTGTVAATDADGDTLTYSLVTRPTHGAVSLNATTGAYTYRPFLNFDGTDSFTFKANDGKADSNVATVSITFTPVNDAPLVGTQQLTTAEDTPLPGQLGALDPEGDPVTFALDTGPQHGTVAIAADGTFTYTPNPNFFGTDGFLFRATDSHGAVSGLGGVSLTVTPVNDAPTAADDSYEVAEDGVLTIAAPAPITRLHMVSQPGDFIGQGKTYDFTPANATFTADTNFANGAHFFLTTPDPSSFWLLDFAAADKTPLTPGVYLDAMRFGFQDPGHPGLEVFGDGNGANTLTGQFTVFDVVRDATQTQILSFAAAFEQHSDGADPALVGWVMYNTTFGTGAGVLANDTDTEGDLLLGAALVDGPRHGTLAFNGDGTFSYTPDPDFNGTDTFTYRTNDGRADSNLATVTLTVTPVNDAPVANNLSVSTAEDTAKNGQVSATDADGDRLTYAVATGPAHGTLSLATDGSFTYTPAANYNGTDSFTFTATDGTATSDPATVSITVTPVNDPPVAAAQNLTTDEDTDLLGTLSAVDVDGDPLTYAVQAPPTHGTLSLNPNGSFTYTPAANYNGTDSFSFKAGDGTATSTAAAVSITVTPVNDAPTLAPATFSLPENSPNGRGVGTVTGSDVDGDTLTYSITGGNTGGAFAIDPATGKITVANSTALDFDTTPTFALTVQVKDPGGLTGTGTVTVNLTSVAGPPQVTIDIRPGDSRNTVNVRSHGKIEVAILSTADFDARTVDVSSLHFGRTGTEDSLSMNPRHGPRYRLADVNGDGRLDLVVEFETELTGFRAGDTVGVLTGQLLDGTAFSATDSVSVKSPGKDHGHHGGGWLWGWLGRHSCPPDHHDGGDHGHNGPDHHSGHGD